jgi:hypothetical protein
MKPQESQLRNMIPRMNHDTNIQHEGDCPDCVSFEKQIDKLHGRIQQKDNEIYDLKSENAELLDSLKTCWTLLKARQ